MNGFGRRKHRRIEENLKHSGMMPYKTQEKEIEKTLHIFSKKNDERGEKMNARRGFCAMQRRGGQRGRGMGRCRGFGSL